MYACDLHPKSRVEDCWLLCATFVAHVALTIQGIVDISVHVSSGLQISNIILSRIFNGLANEKHVACTNLFGGINVFVDVYTCLCV